MGMATEGTMTKTPMDSDSFLSNLRKSGLVSTQRLAAALDNVPLNGHGKTVARALVQKGLLTKFQAELLLVGRNTGFVLGQYRILDLLGQGGMGRVFKAEHIAMGRTVALKVLAPQHTKTEKARALFIREVQAAAKLMHPNIVTAHDANDIDGRHYLVMEYIDGPNLDQLVRERGTLTVGLACDIIRQAASGLQHAYEQGMVHRDIKPSNIILQRTGSTLSSGYLVKIVDFGLACLVDALEDDDVAGAGANNVVVGTPDYLSPEQATNLRMVDIRSDLYSLGCTFYFLLTGQVPFPDGSPLEKLNRHTGEEPVPVEQLRPDIPQEVASIVRTLMAKHPGHRYQRPVELVLELMPLAAPVPCAWPAAKSPPAPSPGTDTVETAANTGAGPQAPAGAEEAPADNMTAVDALLQEDIMPMPQLETQPIPATGPHAGPRWTALTLAVLAGGALGAALMAALLSLLR
jgi:eukaryotic-like serine/threonine-protein kinase